MIAELFLTDNRDIESVVGVTSLFKKIRDYGVFLL
jgi:hypothetical protein